METTRETKRGPLFAPARARSTYLNHFQDLLRRRRPRRAEGPHASACRIPAKHIYEMPL